MVKSYFFGLGAPLVGGQVLFVTYSILKIEDAPSWHSCPLSIRNIYYESNLTLPQARIQGRAAAQAVTRKKSYYDEPVIAAGYNFVPMALENRGLWSKEFKDFFSQVIKHGSQHNHIKPAILRRY